MMDKTNTLMTMFISRNKSDRVFANRQSIDWPMISYIPTKWDDSPTSQVGNGITVARYSNSTTPLSQIPRSCEAPTRLRWDTGPTTTILYEAIAPEVSLSIPGWKITDPHEAKIPSTRPDVLYPNAVSEERVHWNEYLPNNGECALEVVDSLKDDGYYVARYDNHALEDINMDHEPGSGPPMCRDLSLEMCGVSSVSSPSEVSQHSDCDMGLDFDEADVDMWKDGKGRGVLCGVEFTLPYKLIDNSPSTQGSVSPRDIEELYAESIISEVNDIDDTPVYPIGFPCPKDLEDQARGYQFISAADWGTVAQEYDIQSHFQNHEGPIDNSFATTQPTSHSRTGGSFPWTICPPDLCMAETEGTQVYSRATGLSSLLASNTRAPVCMRAGPRQNEGEISAVGKRRSKRLSVQRSVSYFRKSSSYKVAPRKQ